MNDHNPSATPAIVTNAEINAFGSAFSEPHASVQDAMRAGIEAMITVPTGDALNDRPLSWMTRARARALIRERNDWKAAAQHIDRARDMAAREQRAEALRDAAQDFAEGAWADQWLADGVHDDVSAVQSTERWLLARATRLTSNDTP